MKKTYIVPSVETTSIELMQIIAVSAQAGICEGSHTAESKEIDYDDDWGYNFDHY